MLKAKKSSISITETQKNMKICMYTFFFVACALSCVTDCYQHKQAETETIMKVCMYLDFICCVCNMLLYNLLLLMLLIVICPINTLLCIPLSAHGNYRNTNFMCARPAHAI